MKTKFGFIQALKNYVLDECGEVNLGAESAPAEVSESSDMSSEESSLESEESADFSDDSEGESESGDIEVAAENEQELEQEIQEAAENGATEEQIKSMIRKYNLKIDGEEIEQEIDLDNDEEMIKTLQLAKKSHKTMQEKAELERATASFLQQMRNNPFEALKQLDPDFDEMSYVSNFVDNLIKQNEMTPEEKENARIKSEYEQMLQERDRLKKENEERLRAEQTQQLVNQIKADITKELEADEDLVVNDNNIALIAQEMAKASADNVDLTPRQALDIAKKRIQNEYNQYSKSFKSTASMKKYMGDELLEKLREERAQTAIKQQQVKNAKVNPVGNKASSSEPEKKKISIGDILAGRATWDDYEE